MSSKAPCWISRESFSPNSFCMRSWFRIHATMTRITKRTRCPKIEFFST